MKALKTLLEAEGIDPSTLQLLYEHGDEQAFRLTVTQTPARNLAESIWQSSSMRWAELNDLAERTGYRPVILGDREQMERVAKQARTKTWGPTSALVEKSLSRSGEQCLQDAFEEFLSFRQEDLDSLRDRGEGDSERAQGLAAALASDDPFRCMPRGAWPRGVGAQRITTPYDPDTGEHLPEVFLALVPTRASWQVPLYLQFGGFNWCPDPGVIGAVLRYWEGKHGADMICLSTNVLELRVFEPVETREDALALAREQFVFCRDIVEQGTGTIDRLAAGLLDSDTWFFWWD